MDSVLAIIIGYLLGSISPAFFLGKILEGIDIRQHGTKNAGATNVKHLLGLGPAIATAIFDLSKGVLAIWIASLFSIPTFIIYFAGFAAIVGHIFPFYLRFCGGQGVATAVGLLFFFAVKLMLLGVVNWQAMLPALIVLAFFVLSILFIMRDERALGILTLPPLIVFLLINVKPCLELYFLLALLIFKVSINILVIFQQKVFAGKVPKEKAAHLFNWRTFARPAAALLIVLAYLIPKNLFLDIVGGIALVFILIDIIRIFSQRVNLALLKGFLKPKDKSNFSSMTYFMTAVFLIYLLFPLDIASLATIFLIFGDLAGKIFGIMYSRIFFWNKSVEGSLAYFAFCLLFGMIFLQFVNFPLYLMILGAFAATATDAFSLFGIDDNFTVGLISAGAILAIRTLI